MNRIHAVFLAATLFVAASGLAQAPANAPAGSTGICKDGTYTSSPTKKGACRGHQGVKEWYAAAAAAPKAAAPRRATAPAPSAGPAAGVTGLCNDGTTTSAPSKKGACRGHKGVKEWYGAVSAPSAAPAAAAPAVAPAPAPSARPAAGVSGLCNDGTTTSALNKKGACRGHKGVKEWYGAAGAPSAAPAAAAPAVAPAPAAAPRAAPAAAETMPAAVAAPGGGPGLVWVNKSTKVYHCAGDEWYGRTKSGAYMSEADAQTQGFRPAHGKACTR